MAPCAGTVTDEMVLTIQNQPDVEAGSNLTICEGDTVTTIDATVTGDKFNIMVNAKWNRNF